MLHYVKHCRYNLKIQHGRVLIFGFVAATYITDACGGEIAVDLSKLTQRSNRNLRKFSKFYNTDLASSHRQLAYREEDDKRSKWRAETPAEGLPHPRTLPCAPRAAVPMRSTSSRGAGKSSPPAPRPRLASWSSTGALGTAAGSASWATGFPLPRTPSACRPRICRVTDSPTILFPATGTDLHTVNRIRYLHHRRGRRPSVFSLAMYISRARCLHFRGVPAVGREGQ